MINTTVNNILVPLNLTAEGRNSIKQAMMIHEKFNAKITFLYIIPMKNLLTRLFHPIGQIRYKHNAVRDLEEYVSEYYGGKIPEFVRLKVKRGTIVRIVISLISAIRYDLIIINKKLEQRTCLLQNWESGIKLIAGEAFCPVLIFNDIPTESDINEILVPIEINRRHKHNIVWAIELAQRYNADVHLVSVLNSKIRIEKSRIYRKVSRIKKWVAKSNISCEVTFLRSSNNKPHQVIAEYINQAKKDLALIMTHQEAILDINSIGDMASEVITESEQPVFVITPKKETLITILIDVLKTKK